MDCSLSVTRAPASPIARIRSLAALVVAATIVVNLVAAPAGGAVASGSATKPCAFAESLAEANEDKAARKAYVAVLEANPASKCAQDGLAKVNEPSGKSTGDERTEIVDEVLGWLGALAVGAGVVILLFLILLCFAYIPAIEGWMRTLPLIGVPISRVLAPRLAFGTIEDEAVQAKLGPPFMARIKERLGRMREEALSQRSEYDLDFGGPRQDFADLVSGNGGLESALKSASDISEQTKAVAALLNILYTFLPIKRFEISGSLEPPVATGAAVTLILEEGGNFKAASTLKEPPPAKPSANWEPKAAEYMQLADPAAVWIQYEVASELGHEDGDPEQAESQALIREGIECYERGEPEKARARYEKALQLNKDNWAAYVGLAMTAARLGKDFSGSIERLEEGLALIKQAANA